MEGKVMDPKDKVALEKPLTMTLAPHIRSNETTRRIMLDVIIALAPAMIGSVYFYGISALILLLASVASAVVAEYLTQKLFKKEILIGDLSAVVTGILLAFNLPANAPWWIAVFGSVFAIVIVKEFWRNWFKLYEPCTSS